MLDDPLLLDPADWLDRPLLLVPPEELPPLEAVPPEAPPDPLVVTVSVEDPPVFPELSAPPPDPPHPMPRPRTQNMKSCPKR